MYNERYTGDSKQNRQMRLSSCIEKITHANSHYAAVMVVVVREGRSGNRPVFPTVGYLKDLTYQAGTGGQGGLCAIHQNSWSD